MCERCNEQEFVCLNCGAVQGTMIPYQCIRRELKNLLWTSQSENFVWILRFEGRPVKVGCGSLTKLNNETRPNANYIRFDTVWIYWCDNIDDSKALACRLMGEIQGLVNRRGVINNRYKTRNEMRWKSNPPASVRNMLLDSPDFEIAGIGYWDVDKLSQYGVS